jgi:predicted Rdx family selenoprotein
VGGHGGVFDVTVDGQLAFTNKGRGCGVPAASEVVEALEAVVRD